MIWLDANMPFSRFVKLGKNRSGTLIEVLIGNKRKRFLIGDLNDNGSFEAGSKEFDVYVLKYSVIYSF